MRRNLRDTIFKDFVRFVRNLYRTEKLIQLHEPKFNGNEKKYLSESINSSYVSTTGNFVNEFEHKVAEYVQIEHAISAVNGTAGLHVALLLSGVGRGTEVITQSLTFVATSNAIRYCDATPIFVDVERSTLGLSPEALQEFLGECCEVRDDGLCWNWVTERVVSACLPMHSFGFPVRLDEITEICVQYHIPVVADAAQSLGSLYKDKHVAAAGKIAVLSFNGNKIITTGGGGMILTDDDEFSERANHITRTAKLSHGWAFEHDEIGYNYRMPNLNAALGLAQMESLPVFVENKRRIALEYQRWGIEHGVEFVTEPPDTRANYWLNVLLTQDRSERDALLKVSNSRYVTTRPCWTPMHKLKMNEDCQKGEMTVTNWLFDRLVNVPSGAFDTSSLD